MSSSTLATIQTQIALYGYSILMILGNVGGVFNVILFSRQRQSACALYLLSAALVNIFYLTFSGFIRIFPYNYNEETIQAIVSCKMYAYMPGVFGQVTKTILVLACIDRFMITNDRATYRAYSTPKRAKYLIGFSFIFWSIMAIHIPTMTTVINRQCIRVGIYLQIFTIYSILFIGLIPPMICGIFGYLTYRNMRRRTVRVQPVAQNTNGTTISIRRRDRDLLVIVITEVFVYTFTTVLLPIVQLETIISQHIMSYKSTLHLQIESFILSIAYLLLYVNSATPFYTYLIAVTAFRRDFKQLIINGYQNLRR